MAIIKILRTVAGEEIIGEVLSDDEDIIMIKNPCLIGLTMSQQGQPSINMQRLLPFSSDTEVGIYKKNLLFIVGVDAKIEMKYNEIFGNIIVAQSKKIITG
jgi:hypothetical protein